MMHLQQLVTALLLHGKCVAGPCATCRNARERTEFSAYCSMLSCFVPPDFGCVAHETERKDQAAP